MRLLCVMTSAAQSSALSNHLVRSLHVLSCLVHIWLPSTVRRYEMVPSWSKSKRTGCQEREHVRQQGEHVKRPDAFLFRDSDWGRQLVPAKEVSKYEMRLFCIKTSVVKAAESCRDRLVTVRSAVWNASWENLTKLSSASNFAVNAPRSKALCTSGVAQDHKGCDEQVRHDVNLKQGSWRGVVLLGKQIRL